jgi:branched-chain amino acid transport system ATP-binding protein
LATKPLLELRTVEAGYGELQILKGVSVTVKPAEIVALIGPNGAGKSTVLKTVYGLTVIGSGSVVYQGEVITRAKPYTLLQKGISYVPQGRINFSELTVYENLELGLPDISKEEKTKRIADVYKRFPVLERKAKHHAFSLSGGEQQMLAIGRALLQQPKLLLMDEPSLGLSPKLQQELFIIIRELGKSGIAVLLVEQNAKKAIEIADRTYLLEQGQVALEGNKSIVKHKKIKEVYLGGA